MVQVHVTTPMPPKHVSLLARSDPLSIWLILLGSFLTINGISFVASPAKQVTAVLVDQPVPHTCRGWGCGDARRGSMAAQHATTATQLAEHVTATLGASYVALGLLTLGLSLTPQRRIGSLALVVWSAIQLIFLNPTFMDAGILRQRLTFHAMVVCLTLAAMVLSTLRRGGASEAKAD